MKEATALDQLKSLLGIWYTDSPTWPPAPGVSEALRLLAQVERDELTTKAEYVRVIRESARQDPSFCRRFDCPQLASVPPDWKGSR